MIILKVTKNMNTTKLLNQKTDKEYIKVKDKTVIYYLQIDSLTEDQMEDMMVDSIHYGYAESYT